MRKVLDKFYSNNIVLIVALIGSLIGWISWSISNYFINETKLVVFGIIFATIAALLVFSFIKGETNIQKFLFGSLFTFLFIDIIEILFVYISLIEIVGVFCVVITSLILATSIIVFICHMLQQSDHTGKTVSSIVSQSCGLLMVLWLVFFIYMAIKGLAAANDLTFVIAAIFTYFMLLCIETRIKIYKQIRTNAISTNTWNESTRKEAKKIFKF